MPPVSLTPDDYLTLNRLATVARLLSGAAHEVNNALQVISGSVELLQGYPDMPEPVRTGLDRISGQVSRAAKAIMGVSAFSRMQGDGVHRIDVRELTTRAVALRQHAIARAGLTVGHQASPRRSLRERSRRAPAAGHAEPDRERRARAARHQGRLDPGRGLRGRRRPRDPRARQRPRHPPVGIRDRMFDPFVSTRPKTETPGLACRWQA